MTVWKQLLVCVVVVVIAVFGAAKVSPGAAAFLAGHGLAAPMQLLGLSAPPEAGKTDAAPQPPNAGQRGGPRATTVVVQPAGTAIINDKVTALGTGAALQSVIVLPKANGALTEISVSSGATVTAGQVIARLDSENQQLAREKAVLAADDARRSLERNKALVQSNAAPANQTQAVELAEQMADLAVRAADQDLVDRVIAAPINGVLGILKVSLGNSVTPQTEIVSIEDSSSLVVNFWLPERLVAQIKVGDDADLVPVARPELTLNAKITSLDNQIDPASGTFQVQAQVANPDNSLRPGMSFTVSMQFAGQSYVTVNPLSVQWGSSGAYVWRVSADKAEKVAVRVVQRNTETVLVAGEIAAGDSIVTEGLDGLKPGADVQLPGAAKAPADGAKTANGESRKPKPAGE
ncbi:MAG: efflux RND transporter periplasmic adaptor subunit [Deltaproteobacteria bacterium]